MAQDWRPTASIDTLRRRAELLATVRAFFAQRGVLEVETPALMPSTATDIYIDSFRVEAPAPLFLQTSPEFALKRLLAAGSGALYQMGKVFRRESESRRHSVEFTMLEWYRPGFGLEQLMDEVEALVSEVINTASGRSARADSTPESPHESPNESPALVDRPPVTEGEDAEAKPFARFSYRELFVSHLGIDPHTASDGDVERLARAKIDLSAEGLSRTDHLQLLLAHCIEPSLPFACFLYDYPIQQAALARIERDALGQSVARRFELFVAGMELANGYYELQDPSEQRARFESDIAERARRGFDPVPVDEDLLAALEHGLPECSGVALGVDRLVMVALGEEEISRVQAF